LFWIEATATIFGILAVWLTVRRNILCWPAGLVQVLLYIYIFFAVKLYSDLVLHVFYVFLQFFGWYNWLHGGDDQGKLEVNRLERTSLARWVFISLAGTILWGWGMTRFTDASLPYPDAFTTVMSLTATWLMAKKKLDSWFFWISVDVVAIGVYYYKGLYMTCGLYSVFLILATIGYFTWRRVLPEAGPATGWT
jgi:nicotinamide mononucleotide transporter